MSSLTVRLVVPGELQLGVQDHRLAKLFVPESRVDPIRCEELARRFRISALLSSES